MSKKTHSSHFAEKVSLRMEAMGDMPNPKVLDAFSANGDIWNHIAKRKPCRVLRIEKEKGKDGTYLRGDNVKWMKALDLSQFDIIDLDAYGSAHEQLKVLREKNYQGVVCVTWIFGMAGTASEVLEAIGVSKEMVRTAPTLLEELSFPAVFEWMRVNLGVNEVRLAQTYDKKKGFRRLYFWFKMVHCEN